MITIKGILFKIKKIFGLTSRPNQSVYISDIGAKRWAYISYVTDIFYDNKNINFHQNRREALIINKIFNDLGYNTFIHDYQNHDYRGLKKYKFAIIFGIEPNMESVAQLFPKAIKIFYGTCAYKDHQNTQVIRRTDEFNNKHNCQLPYRRLAVEHHSAEMADAIIQIGSYATLMTYPEYLRNKITLIHQSTTKTTIRSDSNRNTVNCNHYVYLGSVGNILRGLHYLLDYFIKHQEIELHVIGPVEEDVLEAYDNTLTPNIHLYGFLDTSTQLFHEIMTQCSFQFYISGSEGCPGSLLTCLQHGLIPIMSPWVVPDGLNCGYILKEYAEQDITASVNWAKSLSTETIMEMRAACSEYVTQNYTLERFESDFSLALTQAIARTDNNQ